jgi:hypothetical protein
MGMKARKELNERNLNEPVKVDKSTSKDLDWEHAFIKA